MNTWVKSRGCVWIVLFTRQSASVAEQEPPDHPRGISQHRLGATVVAAHKRRVVLEPVGPTRRTPRRSTLLTEPRNALATVFDRGWFTLTRRAARRRLVALEPCRTVKPPPTRRTPCPNLHHGLRDGHGMGRSVVPGGLGLQHGGFTETDELAEWHWAVTPPSRRPGTHGPSPCPCVSIECTVRRSRDSCQPVS